MTRAEQIRRQLALGLPESWITPELVKAVLIALRMTQPKIRRTKKW